MKDMELNRRITSQVFSIFFSKYALVWLIDWFVFVKNEEYYLNVSTWLLDVYIIWKENSMPDTGFVWISYFSFSLIIAFSSCYLVSSKRMYSDLNDFG